MKRFLLLLAALWSFAALYAQTTRTISGMVTDERGNPVPSATVQVKGTDVGTTTRNDGRFTLTLPANARTLVISYVGYDEREITIGVQSEFAIAITPRLNNELREVVVTALGIARDKRSLSYATQNLKGDQLANKGEANLVNSLQGKVAGVNITSSSGSPGASANINIRGITSFQGSNQPLFVIDGIPVSNDVDRTVGGPISTLGDQQPANRILDLNLGNIESVNILKGPAAAVLYGSRASSGAIVITTKKGAGGRGRLEVTYNTTYGVQKVTGLPEFQNEYGQGLNGVYNPISGNSFGPRFGTTPTRANGLIDANGNVVPYQPYPNNIRDFFETGTMWDNNITVNAGDATQNATLSIGNLYQTGILPATSLNRTNVQFGASTTMKKLKIGGTVTYSSTAQDGILGGNSAGGGSGFSYLVSIPRSFDLLSFRNNYKNPDGSQLFPMLANNIENPYFTAFENPVTSKLSRAMGSITFGYDVYSWLSVSYRLGVDAYTDRRRQIFAVTSRVRPTGQVLEDIFYRNELNGDLIITARKNDIFRKGLNASVLLGQNVNQRKFQNVTARGDDLTIPGFYHLSNATTFTNGTAEASSTQRLLGYYAQMSFDWNNYLFLELTGRVDQSSTLPKNKNTYFYPSVSAGFVFTDALKMQSKVLSYGKLRASAAKVGRDAPPYLLQNVYVPGTFGNNVAGVGFPIGVGGGNINGFSLSGRIANENINPEFTTSYEVGLNLGLFKSRITLDVAYFDQVSKDQIINVAVPASTGFTSRTANVGKMTNKGIEILVNALPVNAKNFRWEVSANFTRIRNKVVEIFDDIQNFAISSGQSFGGVVPSIAIGEAYGVIIGNKFPRSPDGQFIINPATGLFNPGIPNQVLADPNPDWTAGVTNTFRYKNISFSFLWDMTYGGDIFSFTVPFFRSAGALKETAVDREVPMIIPGVIQTGPDKFEPNTIQINAQTYWRAAGIASDLSVFDATVLRLRELTLAYDLPQTILQKTPLSSVRFGVFARNVFFYAPNYPMDPEVNTQGAGNLRGLDLQGAPNGRTIGMNLRVSFK
jgi:TonB-linked SusC/RagA family outer membrane protein